MDTETKRPKRKLHLNWNAEKSWWIVKKAFGFYPVQSQFSEAELRSYLADNLDIDTVLRFI